MAHEPRNQYCWSCKYFEQDSTDNKNGWCMRHAPSRHDWDVSQAMTVPDGWNVFAIIVDGTLIQCGEYERLMGEVPEIPTGGV